MLTSGLEIVVALLRNARKSTNTDVELYLESHEKFILKLKRVDASTLDEAKVNVHHGKL